MAQTANTYDREQAKLHSQREGAPDPDEISIPPPKEPEVNPEIYRDVEPLLFRGFLTAAAEINDVLFVFKSFNHHEYELLRLMGGLQDREPTQTFWNLFLAYGVFMVDGINVLNDRDRVLRDIARTFADFPPGARTKLIRNLSELNRRASVATILTEAYATENYSRHRWAQIRGLDLMTPSVTGVTGTERLGLNYGQMTWRALNHYTDLQEQMEREWENAKFIGSCFAGKGIQKVHTADERRRSKQRDTILARKDALIRHAIFGAPIDDGKQQKGNRVVYAANTVEELTSQLQSSLRGEKDWHDRVVEDYENQIRSRYADQEQKLKEMFEARNVEFGNRPVSGTTKLEGLTPQEVNERVTRRRQLMAQQVSQRVLVPQLDEDVNARHHRWGLVGPETSITETDRDPSQVFPTPRTSEPGRPFRR